MMNVKIIMIIKCCFYFTKYKKLPGMYSNGMKDNFNTVLAEKYEIFRTNDR